MISFRRSEKQIRHALADSARGLSAKDNQEPWPLSDDPMAEHGKAVERELPSR